MGEKILLLGGAGFIGTNLAICNNLKRECQITIADTNESYYEPIKDIGLKNIQYVTCTIDNAISFNELVKNQDIVYHLVSTTVPTTSNQHITEELEANVIMTSRLLEACVQENVKKVVFLSSGGTVYGKEVLCPLKEETATNPITSYGIQKVTIEKLLYLYNYMYGLDYRVIRLANPYGPYQRPNGVLGAVTTFTYKALKKEEIIVYGDGSVVRDFIYIDDAIRGITNIVDGNNKHRVYNLGCGYGTSINHLLKIIESTLDTKLNVKYMPGRRVDVPQNYLDISRYEKYFGRLDPISLEEGIIRTADFMKRVYNV